MKRTTKHRNFGLKWIDEGRLGDWTSWTTSPCWKTRRMG